LVEGSEAVSYKVISHADFAGCIGFIDPYVFPAMKAAGQ
jgi:hypothetical protein